MYVKHTLEVLAMFRDRVSLGKPGRLGSVVGGALLLSLVAHRDVLAVGPNAVRDLPGFATSTLEPNDDDSTDFVPLGFSLNFSGTTYDDVFVNNNGNVTFGDSLGDFTPVELTGTEHVIIAAFWADVDTRP